jgi:prepilin-type N-terminal cleavage/methylation domain-containing protein
MKRAFTLIELMVVMAIIAVLSTLIIGAISIARKTAKNTEATGTAKTLETALESYSTSHSTKYPAVVSSCSITSGRAFYWELNSGAKVGLHKFLRDNNFLSSDLTATDKILYFTDQTACNVSRYTLTVCDTDSFPNNENADYTKMIPGTPNDSGTVGPCTGGKVIYSSAR